MAQTSDQQPPQIAASPGLSPAGRAAVGRDQVRTVFGQVMRLVAATVGFTALGAYIGRNLTGGTGILFFIAGFACIFGLQFATARGREQLAIGLLFGLGLALGLAVAPVIHAYAKADPPRCGRRPAPPQRPSPGWARSARPPGTTSRAGRGSCSGRCSL